MTPDQKQQIRSTFARIAPMTPFAARLFYNRLFEIAPETQTLFRYEPGTLGMERQGAKLFQTLEFAVAHLDNLDAALPEIQALAQRHVDYGVTPAHYDSVGAALRWTLEQTLAAAFTPEAEAAWARLYAMLADAMKQAAYAPSTAA